MKSSKSLAPSVKPVWQDFSYNIPKKFPPLVPPPPNYSRSIPSKSIREFDLRHSFRDYNNNDLINAQSQAQQRINKSRAPITSPLQRRRYIELHENSNNISNIPHQLLAKHAEQKHFEKSIKSRNLEVSRHLRNHFKSGMRSNIVVGPRQNFLSETHDSYRIPGKERPVPIPNSGYRTMIDSTSMSSKTDNVNKGLYRRNKRDPVEAFHSLHSEDVQIIRNMKSHLLAGNHVSRTDIAALRAKMRVTHFNNYDPTEAVRGGIYPLSYHRGHHNARRLIARKPIFCNKGIVYVPTPHTKHPESNSFGTPADLRVSLANVDVPESDRRRFCFDFRQFTNDEINLYLEGSRRLVIQGVRPGRDEEKRAKITTDYIDLPKDLPVDNLRMVRDIFGHLIVEEAWKFV